MLKRLSVAVAALFVLATQAYGAGTIPYSLSQQFDKTGHVLSGCILNIIQAGTVGTPQIAYQDTALTIPVPGGSRIVCDAAGRLPQFFLADGNIKIILTDKNGVTQVTADNILVIGNSSGGGGGGGVDPTTVLATGDIKASYGTGILTGFVRANGRTIGSATSGASERANSDTQALFQYLWNTDSNLVVPSGRGASANADWVANKQITLPDWRGRVIAGLDAMGNSAAGRLGNAAGFNGDATVLGASGGLEIPTLAASQIPSITSNNGSGTTVTLCANGNCALSFPVTTGSVGSTNAQVAGAVLAPQTNTSWLTGANVSGNITVGVTSTNTGGNPYNNVQPTMLTTIYIKL